MRIDRIEAQRIARIERMSIIALGDAGHIEIRVLYLRIGQR